MNFYIVDVFSEAKYQGNPLAVFFSDQDVSDHEMLRIANELHFSETTFVLSPKQPNGGYDVRIFTPDAEVPFAGHPTLGTAYVINQVKESGQSSRIILNLTVGQIPVDITDGLLTMRQNQPAFGSVSDDYELIAEALSVNRDDLRTDYPCQWVSTGLPCVVIPLKSVDALARCRVNHSRFDQALTVCGNCNFFLFADDLKMNDCFRARVFTNDTGYVEDPGTGSANGNFAAYLLKHRYLGRDEIHVIVNQGLEMGRPSKLIIDAFISDGVYDIRVGGQVHHVACGTW